MEQVARTQRCPQCGEKIPVYTGYVTWCDKCGWNVHPSAKAPARDFLSSIYDRLGRKRSQVLLEQVMRAKSLRPTWTLAKLPAFPLATLVHAATLALIIVGIWLIVQGWPLLVMIVAGIFCLLIAWALRPRFTEPPDSILGREMFPAVYRFVDRISAALGTVGPAAVGIDGQFNSGIAYVPTIALASGIGS